MKATINSSLCSTKATNAGFTLIELMVTIAVMAIIVSIAAPSISTQLANQRVKSTTATLASALKEAKVESVIRRQNVTLSYDSASSPKTITLTANSATISKYNISSQSTIAITPTGATSIVFRPNKSISSTTAVVYSVCDSSSTTETAKQVTVTSIANIDSLNAGSC